MSIRASIRGSIHSAIRGSIASITPFCGEGIGELYDNVELASCTQLHSESTSFLGSISSDFSLQTKTELSKD